MTYTVEALGLRKSFGPKVVLAGLDLAVATGSVYALLGVNGAGKTTLVRILATLDRADGGRARVAGHDPATEGRATRRAIALTGQYAAVDELLTGRENLVLMARLRRLSSGSARRRTGDLLEQLDLEEAADRRVGTYSGGMKRRLDLAVSMIERPRVLFLDEPTTGLDPRSREQVWSMVRGFAAEGVTILLTTQYLEEADRLADRVGVLDQGRIVAEGTPDELKSTVGAERVRLRLADQVGLEAARRVFPDGAVDADLRTLSVATDGSAAALAEVLATVSGHALPVCRVDTVRSTLDDVFLTLTDPRDHAA